MTEGVRRGVGAGAGVEGVMMSTSGAGSAAISAGETSLAMGAGFVFGALSSLASGVEDGTAPEASASSLGVGGQEAKVEAGTSKSCTGCAAR